MDRTERFYKIQTLLRQRRSVTMRQLCEALEVSRATVCRDLDYLRDRLGVPVNWDSASRSYRLEGFEGQVDGHELPGVWFSEREIHALLTIIELMSQLEPEGLLSPRIAPFRERLEQLLEQGTGSAVEALNRIRIIPMGQRQVSSDHFQLIAHGLLKRRRLHIAYYGRQSDVIVSRDISPQRLVYYRDNWYLDAYCHLREGLRSFSIDAIRLANLLQEQCVDLNEAEVSNFFESSYGIFNGPSRQVARLKFSPFRARWVARERWHPEQVSTVMPDGSYVLDVPYGQDWELIQDILKQGADVEVLAPDGLRGKVADAIRSMASLYDGVS
ncbi:helix-turn-helix transcriptional regulator [Orrella daihaiensis]|uniref:WYL domain-containing protein n=1 Tax=Orrella daihaiensis TaxID=2782176 RepID=A0ABY4ANJ2_9BURK|nr:WYL domain-containing protein [Orrella daihaiensis]UOD50960.1 WYL domain-containing protein [Orrella daihaiensis]